MEDNKLPNDTTSDPTGVDAVDDGLATPEFREELGALAPHLLEQYDSIRRRMELQLEEAERRCNQIKADLAKDKANSLSSLNQAQGSLGGASNGSSDRTRSTDSSPVSLQFKQQPQATTQAKTRVALSTRTDSNPASSPVSQQPQATTKAKQRVALSTSSDSNPASPPASQQPQTTTKAKKRVTLSTSTDSIDSILASPPASQHQQPQATTQAKTRVALLTSTDSFGSIPASPPPYKEPQATTQAKTRVALSTSTSSDPASVSTQKKQQSENSTEAKRSTLSTDTGTDYSGTSSARARKVSSRQAMLTMRIQIRLILVIKLLTASVTTPETRARALALAHEALQYAQDNNAPPALQARCSFYIAHATYDQKDSRHTQDAVVWFQRAVEADQGEYPEGQWAQEWLNRYESLNMESRPNTGSNWIANISNNVWSAVFGANAPSEESDPQAALKPRPGFFKRLYSNENTRPAKNNYPGSGRIPSYTTWNSGEAASQTGEGASPGSINEASPIVLRYAKVPSPTTTSPAKEAAGPQTPSSGASTRTQDYYGVKWSPGHPFGKGKILGGREFDLLQSPEMMSPFPVIPEEAYQEEQHEEEQPQHLPANVHGGLVDAPKRELSFRAKRMMKHAEVRYPGWQTILENLDHFLPPVKGKLRIMNQTVSLPSTGSPDSLDFQRQPAESLCVVNRTFLPSDSSPSSRATQGSSYSASSSAPSSFPLPFPSPSSRTQSAALPSTHKPLSPSTSTAPVKAHTQGPKRSERICVHNKKRDSIQAIGEMLEAVRFKGFEGEWEDEDEEEAEGKGENSAIGGPGKKEEGSTTGLYRRWKGGEGSGGDGSGDVAMEKVRLSWSGESAADDGLKEDETW
jgi:hypothetical protein